MRYELLRARPDAAFRRFCGVPKPTFLAMLEVLEQAEATKPVGRPSKLALADQLLLALSYWREYRTLFHIASDYGLHESTASRIVVKVEDALIASGRFSLRLERAAAVTQVFDFGHRAGAGLCRRSINVLF